MRKEKNRVLFTCPMSSIMPIIRPVGDLCNLKCDYCYYNSTNQKFCGNMVMSDEVLEAFISQFLDLSGDDATFVWHGGEPLLAGIDFYYKVIEFENRYKRQGQIVKNNVQTNGIMINKTWATFFREYDFHVGMSLDGIQCCHDRFRKNQNGDGSFRQVIAAISLLREFGIEPGILQTATKFSMQFIEDSFSYFVDTLKIKKWGVNVYNDKGIFNPLMKGQSLSNDDYFLLYKTLFDIWLNRDDPSIEIREIDTFVSGILGKYSGICQNSGICSSFIALDPDGTVTPTCESYYFDDDYKKESNILKNRLLNILNGNQRIKFSEIINHIPVECKECKWHLGCYNGCTNQRNSNNHYLYCEGRKKLFSYLWDCINNYVKL